MSVDDHGSCLHCGFDLNGERIWDTFFKKERSEEEATRIAEMYGASKGFGRFGKEIYYKYYEGEGYTDKKRVYVCPSCGKSCYDKDDVETYIAPTILKERFGNESSDT